ncbi:MAG: RimK/LysX family protein [Hyphomicrobiaceae bacterium]
MADAATPFVLGWEEWVALPDLGLPAIKAKIDTGARTSALHAFLVEPFGPIAQPRVRFGIHPIPGRNDIEIYCAAPVVDRREVTSSNGERETRYVILSTIEIGGRRWPIEITLTNRETMAYRMLLGRQAIREDVYVDPSASFRQPRLSYKLYRHIPTRDIVHRPLRVALLTRTPERPSNQRLLAAAADRGHVLEIIDVARLAIGFRGRPCLEHDGAPLAHYDAVLPRLPAKEGPLAIAAIRELELAGATAINPAAAVERLRDPVAAMQLLAHQSIAVAPPSRTASEQSTEWGRRRAHPVTRLLVIGGDIVGAAEVRHGTMRDTGSRKLAADRSVAKRAAKALGLGLAAVDVVAGEGEARVVAKVSAAPDIGALEKVTGARIAERIVAEIETSARSWVRRDERAEPDEPKN